MNGEINVESKIGIGSKFVFTVKMKLKPDAMIDKVEIEDGEQTVIREEGNVAGDAETKIEQSVKKRILLVEDNPISQNLELKILREVGYDVEAVSTGFQAIDSIKSGIFDLVLMDVEMTDMDGITATKKVRELGGKESKIPIIAVTAHSSMKDREKCLAAGMDDYIAKPINIHFLKLTIDQWLKSSHRS
jgi:CheY-like chemotaxis protein